MELIGIYEMGGNGVYPLVVNLWFYDISFEVGHMEWLIYGKVFVAMNSSCAFVLPNQSTERINANVLLFIRYGLAKLVIQSLLSPI